MIGTRGGEHGSIGAHGDSPDACRVVENRSGKSSLTGAPSSDLAIVAARRNLKAMPVEKADTGYGRGMPEHRRDGNGRGNVPNPHAVVANSRQPATVRAEHRRVRRRHSIAAKCLELLGGGHVPQD